MIIEFIYFKVFLAKGKIGLKSIFVSWYQPLVSAFLDCIFKVCDVGFCGEESIFL